jgi:hypothetical protein
MAEHGWLRNRWSWPHYPISRRRRRGWNSPLQGLFSPEGDTTFKFMPDLQHDARVPLEERRKVSCLWMGWSHRLLLD